MGSASDLPPSTTRRVLAAPGVAEVEETGGITGKGTSSATTIPIGSSLGRYLVLAMLGKGGMGIVLRAYDPKLHREVALKALRQDVLSSHLQARMVREAQAMAKLSHPNVVSVYDVEQVGDSVVLAMELVDGTTLREWQDRTKPSRQQIVETYLYAGQGLAAAHRAGLLHRDFKPGNVLVSNEGHVKVTDFGLAHVGAERPASHTSEPAWLPSWDISAELTEPGVVLGTPRFMAPEQFDGGELDATVDQYAFCVSLWHALTGQYPFELKGSARSTQKAKEQGSPAWPRGVSVPRGWVRALRKGLAPTPDQRWRDMDELLRQFRRDPRPRRVILAATALAAAGAAVGGWTAWRDAQAERCSGSANEIAGVWDQARAAAVQTAMAQVDKPYTTQAWEQTRVNLDEYAGAWVSMHRETCQATTVRGEQSAAAMDLRMRCLHRAKVGLNATVTTLENADATVVQNAAKLSRGLPALSRCEDLEALSQEIEPPAAEEAAAVEEVRAQLASARAEWDAGRLENAQWAVDRAEARLTDVTYQPVRAEAALRAGEVLEARGKFEEAETALVRALEIGAAAEYLSTVAAASTRLMYVVGYHRQRAEEGLRYLPIAQGFSRLPEDERLLLGRIGAISMLQGKFDDAERWLRAHLELTQRLQGADHPDVALSRNNLGALLVYRDRLAEAEAEFRTALALEEKTLGSEHPSTATSRNNIGVILDRQGKFSESEHEHRAALALRQRALDPDHPDTASSHNNLGHALAGQGRHAEAEAEYRAALAMWQRTVGSEHTDVATVHDNLGVALRQQGRASDAEREHRAALGVWLKTVGSEDANVAGCREGIAAALADQGRLNEAEDEYRAALAVMEKAAGAGHPNTVALRDKSAAFQRQRASRTGAVR